MPNEIPGKEDEANGKETVGRLSGSEPARTLAERLRVRLQNGLRVRCRDSEKNRRDD